MREKIYTIPVNEAFDDQSGKCPFCLLYEKLQEDELTLILGASMMEPDVRIQTNEKGFCGKHFHMLRTRKNRLGLGLIMESHLDEVKKNIKPGGFLARDKSAAPKKGIEALEKSCYICDRIAFNFDNMINTATMLYEGEKEFRTKFAAQKCFCLPHYRKLLEASVRMSKKYREEMAEDAAKVVGAYLDKLKEDVSWFCKKFDYRYDNEPWYDSKDAIERAINFLTAE
ncbi:MAG: hypothetical protein E7597_01690 [Ruminococcaceae bacterium]|nr:hypothetical protein [Oscillospiraceae bacterium]